MILESKDKILQKQNINKKPSDVTSDIEMEFNYLISGDSELISKIQALKKKKELFYNAIFGAKFSFVYLEHRVNIRNTRGIGEKPCVEIILSPENDPSMFYAIITFPAAKLRTITTIEYYIKNTLLSRNVINVNSNIEHILKMISREFNIIISKNNIDVGNGKEIKFRLKDENGLVRILMGI